jgi:hypothetical protein
MNRVRTIKILVFVLMLSIMVGTVNFRVFSGSQDNNVLWDFLYHSANGTNPITEFVPGETFTFLDVGSSGLAQPGMPVTVYALTDWMDTTALSVRYWDGAEHWLAMSWVKNITTSFRGQASRKYDLWKATLPGQTLGKTIYYRIRATDGSSNAYLRRAAARIRIRLGKLSAARTTIRMITSIPL